MTKRHITKTETRTLKDGSKVVSEFYTLTVGGKPYAGGKLYRTDRFYSSSGVYYNFFDRPAE